MSDDEYYGDYDDFEDGYWDVDPAPDLADDLAEHASYSPIWQDDPAGELEPYYSDWEYYSDDYYDDDPVLKQTTLDGVLSTPTTMTKPKVAKRGKKRKLDEARDLQATIEKDSLLDCIKGTVWAQEERDKSAAFQLGQQEGVALLKNWRDQFKSENGFLRTFGRGQLKRDETWANELGLADVGLLSDSKKSGLEEDAPMDDEHEDSLVDIEEDDQELADLATAEELEQPLKASETRSDGFSHAAHLMATHDSESSAKNTTRDPSKARKRRKLAGLPSPPGSNKSTGTVPSEQLNEVQDTDLSKKRKPGRAARTTRDDENANEIKSNASNSAKDSHDQTTRSKKRKLSPDLNDSAAPSEGGNKSRAKRVAAAALIQEPKAINKRPQPAPRLTRSRGR